MEGFASDPQFVEVNKVIDSLKNPHDPQNQDALQRVNSLKTDPSLKDPFKIFQKGLLERIILKDPATDPNLDPEKEQDLRFCIDLAYGLGMGEKEAVDAYLKNVKGRLPAPKKSFSRRLLLGGALATAATTGVGLFLPKPKSDLDLILTPKPKSSNPPDKPTPLPTPQPTPPISVPTASPSPISVEPTKTPIPPTPEPTKGPELDSSLTSEILLSMMEDEALKRRTERRAKNPKEYDKRINEKINKNRVNIVLFGYGAMKWYEANGAQSTQDFRGSHSILCIDTKTGRIDVVTPTDQMLAPEVWRYQHARGEKNPKFDWIDKAFHVGGFDLQRQVIENMTGLSADFQVVLKDSAIKDLVDQVFKGLKIDIPTDIGTMPFRVDGVDYPDYDFKKGPQTLDGLHTIQYIKSLAKSFVAGTWILDAEPNPRKHLVFKNLLKSFEENKFNPSFWLRFKNFMDEETTQKKIETDIDVGSMILSALNPLNTISFMRKKLSGHTPPSKMAINKTIFMQDPNTGADGGVSWIQGTHSPFIKRAVEQDLVAVFHNSVPTTVNANPFSDNLVDEYWKSTRDLVEKTLTS